MGEARPNREAAFRTRDVARILGLGPTRVRSLVRAGVCRPGRVGRWFRFSFQDLVLLRAARDLMRSDVPPPRVGRALAALGKQLTPGRPISGVRIYADGGRVIVREGHSAWDPDSGQGLFLFGVDDLRRATRGVLPMKSARQGASPTPSRGDRAIALFEQGLAQEDSDLAAAVRAYRKAIELDPELLDAYVNLGRILHHWGRVAEAVSLYEQALARDPGDVVAHFNLGLALEDREDPAGAARHYGYAVRMDPGFAEAHLNLARVLDVLGQPKRAQRHYRAYERLTGEPTGGP